MAEEKKRKHDAEEVKEILDVVAEKVPALLNELTDVLYGTEQSKKYGKAVAQFYKELKDAGMSDKEAFELTRQYMSIFNLGGALGKMMGGEGGHEGHGGSHGHGNDLGDEIRDKVKIEIKKSLDEEE
jgi:phosphomevalonate kinase